MDRLLCLFNDEPECFFARIEIVPFILSPGNIPVHFRAPYSVANVYAIVAPIETNEDESSVLVILQVRLKPNPFILVQCSDEIEQVLLFGNLSFV